MYKHWSSNPSSKPPWRTSIYFSSLIVHFTEATINLALNDGFSSSFHMISHGFLHFSDANPICDACRSSLGIIYLLVRGNCKSIAKCAKRWAQWLRQRLEAALSCGERRCQRQCVHVDAHFNDSFEITSWNNGSNLQRRNYAWLHTPCVGRLHALCFNSIVTLNIFRTIPIKI